MSIYKKAVHRNVSVEYNSTNDLILITRTHRNGSMDEIYMDFDEVMSLMDCMSQITEILNHSG